MPSFKQNRVVGPVAVFDGLVGSGADVSVGWDGVGVNAAAVSVNCEMTVLAAEVRMAATSAVGSCACVPGDPHAAISTMNRIAVIINFGFIEPL